MKKIRWILLAVVLLLAASIYSFIRSLGVTNSAALVPQNTVVFIAFPELLRTALRWPSTSLAKISSEPEVQKFLKKPLAAFSQLPNGKETGTKLLEIKPTQIFMALLPFASGEARALLGFQFLGKPQNVTHCLEDLCKKITHNASWSASTSHEEYQGDQITSYISGPTSLYIATQGHWGFLSNHLGTLQETLDRAAGRNPTPSLAVDANYLQVHSHLSTKPDAFIFANIPSVLQSVLAWGAILGYQPDPAQLPSLASLSVAALSCKLEGANMHDTLAVLLKEAHEVPPLNHPGMPLTSAETLGTMDMSLQWPPPCTLSALALKRFLEKAPLSLSELKDTLLPEITLSFCWPMDALRPHPLLVATIKDQNKLLQHLTQLGFAPIPPSPHVPDATFFQLPLPQTPLLAPTVCFYHHCLVAGLAYPDVEEALIKASAPGAKPLPQSPAFEEALPSVHSANLLFSFIDIPRLFERSYITLKPILIFGAAMMPHLARFIDPTQLPAAETISKHLHPLITTERLTGNVLLFDSIGPITLDQTILLTWLVQSGVLHLPKHP